MENDLILILDFGVAQALSVAHKLRAQNYYCEILPCTVDVKSIRRKAPKGILLDGKSEDYIFDERILRMGIPILAMGFCAYAMAKSFGAECEGVRLTNGTSQIIFQSCPLFEGLSESDRFFERIDNFSLPERFAPIATTVEGLAPAFGDLNANLYGLQFYPESNDPDGARILRNFAGMICGCADCWTSEYYIEHEIEILRKRIGSGRVIMAISGGMDSAVCAKLLHKAIGDQLSCVFIDNGLLRKDEAENVVRGFQNSFGTELKVIDTKSRVLSALGGAEDPKQKRQIVRDEFYRAMYREASAIQRVEYLAEGTIYPDVLFERGISSEPAGQSEFLKRIEPLKMLFKDEVRDIGAILGLPQELLHRQPFPTSGLAIRCMGEVTAQKLALLREADAIFTEEITMAGLDRRLSRYFAVLMDCHVSGIRDGKSSAEYACALCAANMHGQSGISIAKLPYDLIDRVVQRIIKQVPGINHVLYDVTGAPTCMAE